MLSSCHEYISRNIRDAQPASSEIQAELLVIMDTNLGDCGSRVLIYGIKVLG